MMIDGKPVSDAVAAVITQATAERDELRKLVLDRLTGIERRIQALEAGTVVRQDVKPFPCDKVSL